ncbi:glycosyltransferase [Halobacterium sp. KA-6]|uniref:glycosyltransferase n=1 Tax=Halobacterium sp. KA-6 TaxID=2896368 RepID=UPI001E5BB4AE|nr:glycosyltransferase [Halobacterium sp. KA-6]MCD2204878.1 glycosyltransferase [Halobacterium sp. KA-6]
MGLGGADKKILSLTKAYLQNGHDVKIVSLVPIGPMGVQARESGAEVISLDIAKSPSAVLDVIDLVREIRSFQPDVLHAQMYYANILSRVVRPLTGVESLVCTVQNTYERDPESGKGADRSLVEHLYRATKSLDDLTSFVSTRAKQRYVDVRAVSEEKATVVPNGTDTSEFVPSAESRSRLRSEFDVEETFVWLAVGRLWRQKDYPTLLEAFSEIDGEAELWIVGKGPLLNDLIELRNNLGLQSRVRFIGPVQPQKVPEYMNAADAFVLSSSWEGLPLVLTEAMSVELPVVATTSGGSKDIIEDGKSGFLVPPESPEKLTEKLDYVMSMGPEERAKIGRNARERITREFSMSAISERWEEIYEQLHSQDVIPDCYL